MPDKVARETEIREPDLRPAKKQRGSQGVRTARFDEVDEISELLDASYLLTKPSTPIARVCHDHAPIPEFVTVEEFAGTIDVVDELVKEVESLKNKGGVSSTKFADLSFKSHEDCFEWVQIHFTKKRYGLIMDPLIMLDKICGDD